MMTVQGFALAGHRVDAVTPDIDWTYDLLPFKGTLSAVCRTKGEAADLVRWFGHEDFMPALPVLLCIPGGWGQLAGMGLATAAELRDEAVARWELQEAKIAKTGRTFDFGAAREKAGLRRTEDIDADVRELMMDRIRYHKANAVTDPSPQRVYPNPTNRQVFPVGDAVMPKEAPGD